MTAIDYNDLDVARALVGDRVPSKSALPAVWWLTADPNQIDAYDRWQADFDARREGVERLAQSIGLTANDAVMTTWGEHSELTGFNAPTRMRYWEGHPDHQPVPEGWRLDKKADRLVPSRKTKSDRESDANKAFAAVKRIPNVRSYMTGLPSEIYLDDREFGGTIYGVNYRRGESCLWAYSGGDPDRQSGDERRHAVIDTSVWHRMKLSILAALMEEKADRAEAGAR
ncbi:hypothetical protein [Mycolicibacterium fortuitum]|uniref:Uncharacterized protein n=1 Tax=Mycolicibacterium fortuitum TaxID=1766 RepID=A0AAE5AG04_MYCFO|nr:hypothetical protein [Mycolicibacterium fortuitum]MDV7194767.1 hypothetical protein [Mycolicibacterium fortuitum]MDV7207670.1 hypothetical protein [Mycolicibacterium fortuitum]MDV7229726.1 hypothetical protein [Mycolicibacterium fortuitum]MDV7261521.1 hypothetical protein [Mycolicibacterium fortuitum]MDV7286699.1 hypothetical protein [Mycolicibacterium fortuitum]